MLKAPTTVVSALIIQPLRGTTFTAPNYFPEPTNGGLLVGTPEAPINL